MIKRILFAFAVALCCSAHAADIEVQGIRLGMTPQELAAVHPGAVQAGVKVAGRPSRRDFAAPTAVFDSGRLVQFAAYFARRDFEPLRAAVLATNPSVRCHADAQVAICFDPQGTFALTLSGGVTTLRLQSLQMANEAQRAMQALLAETAD